MGASHEQADLFPGEPTPKDTIVVNHQCLLRTGEGHRVVIVLGIVVAQYAVGDRMAEAQAMVSLVDQDLAGQNDVARAFGCSARTVRRQQRRFEEGGLCALGRGRGYPAGRSRVAASRVGLIERLKREGRSNREIARSMGIGEKAVRKHLRGLGWKERAPEQTQLPLEAEEGEGADPKLSAFPLEPHGSGAEEVSSAADPKLSAFPAEPAEPVEPASLTLDADPTDRRLDRALAYHGLIHDAVPLFCAGPRIPRAGVLLAVPALVASGVFQVARETYETIGPAFYGLRTTMLALLLMALLRIKRPEAIKEHPPEDLGRLLGLDRAPEVKTLRRKLVRLAALGRATQFGRRLAEGRISARGAAMGFLYVDGHVRVYHGQHTLPKAHVTQMRLAMPATTDYWVNDQSGDPLFVVTASANAGLTKMLPEVLKEVRALIGKRRTTVAFDRGGYSPQLFEKLIDDGFDILTYRKGRFPPVPRNQFHNRRAVIDGRKVRYLLADQRVRLRGCTLRLRQVTRLSGRNHQTPILTSRKDLKAIEVAYRMFERWRQENFFKYLSEEYALDALVEYAVEPDDPKREVPNPTWNSLDAKLRELRADLAKLEAEYARGALHQPKGRRRRQRDLKTAQANLAGAIDETIKRLAAFEADRAAVPRRVPVEAVITNPVKLAGERKHLTNLVKMVAYQAESDLVQLVTPHYKRAAEEGRTLVQSALLAPADLEVSDGELRVSIAPLSSEHRTRAIASLCEALDRSNTVFPGTRLRLRYVVSQGD